MTDRFNGCTVVFGRDIRGDDVEAVLTALRMVKGVLEVIPNVSECNDDIVMTRTKRLLVDRMYDLIGDFMKDDIP